MDISNFLKEWANSLVAICTFLLALVTVIVLIVTVRWNQRNEVMRSLPILRLQGLPDPELIAPGWPKIFYVMGKNIGSGPIVFQEITARQANNEFVPHLTISKQESSMPTWFWEVGEERRILLHLPTQGEGKDKKFITKTGPKGKAPPIKIRVGLFDIFGRLSEIEYEWESIEKRVIYPISISIAGIKRRIPHHHL